MNTKTEIIIGIAFVVLLVGVTVGVAYVLWMILNEIMIRKFTKKVKERIRGSIIYEPSVVCVGRERALKQLAVMLLSSFSWEAPREAGVRYLSI